MLEATPHLDLLHLRPAVEDRCPIPPRGRHHVNRWPHDLAKGLNLTIPSAAKEFVLVAKPALGVAQAILGRDLLQSEVVQETTAIQDLHLDAVSRKTEVSHDLALRLPEVPETTRNAT